MADLQEKVQKLHESQLKAQTELNSLQQKNSESNADRRVKVERLVKQAEDAMTKHSTRTNKYFRLHRSLQMPRHSKLT